MTEFHKKTFEALIVSRSNKIKSNQKAALKTNEKQVGIIWMFLRFAEYVSICLTNFNKGPFLYYVRVKGWVGGTAKYLLFLTGVGGWFWITLM